MIRIILGWTYEKALLRTKDIIVSAIRKLTKEEAIHYLSEVEAFCRGERISLINEGKKMYACFDSLDDEDFEDFEYEEMS